MVTRCDSLVVSDLDSGMEGLRFESPLVHLKDFSFICCLEIPWLTFRPWLRQANPLESLQVGYWGRITTADPAPRDRVCEQS